MPKTELPLQVESWLHSGMTLDEARSVTATTAKTSGWFKNVDRGKYLAELVLERPELQTGPVAHTIAELRRQVYLRHDPTTEPSAAATSELSSDAGPSKAAGEVVPDGSGAGY